MNHSSTPSKHARLVTARNPLPSRPPNPVIPEPFPSPLSATQYTSRSLRIAADDPPNPMSDIFNILLEGGDVDHDALEHGHGFDGGGFGPGGAHSLGEAMGVGVGGGMGVGIDGQAREKKRRNRKVSGPRGDV